MLIILFTVTLNPATDLKSSQLLSAQGLAKFWSALLRTIDTGMEKDSQYVGHTHNTTQPFKKCFCMYVVHFIFRGFKPDFNSHSLLSTIGQGQSD